MFFFIKLLSKLGVGVGFIGGVIENFKKSLMVISLYFIYLIIMYLKVCIVFGFDIVVIFFRRFRRLLVSSEGGGVGFVEFFVGGIIFNKFKIF